jgi:lipopolysaccharide/colanic/teichoic acid biosynthesis glycosyltransferase
MVEAIGVHLQEKIAGGQFRVAGYFAVEPEHQKPVWLGSGVLQKLGRVDDLGEVLVHNVIEHVIAIIPSKGASWLTQVIETCDYFRIHTHVVHGDLLDVQLQDLRYAHRDSFSLPALTLIATDFDSEALFLKRCLDVVVSGALLIALFPLLLLIALLIKLTTPHLPILYRWNVVGCKGRRFTGFKFTTMDTDSDPSKNQLLTDNEMTGPVFKRKDDHRVTPLGRILRKFSLNELPQLWSVLNGDMSLVGPRPAFPHELERYEMWHKRKLSVRPGITCLWQVRGRNKISNFDDWVRMDLEYIQNWSLGLDLSILCRTVWVVVRGTGS